jgi:glyceraldehyde-3-phosphate dehydrogenase/erythrose-4-phosphate dehydrogenase
MSPKLGGPLTSTAPRIVHVVGTGTIGEPLIGLLSDLKEPLGIDEVTFINKHTPRPAEKTKLANLVRRGALLSAAPEAHEGFLAMDTTPHFTSEEAIKRASVVIDCTPKGRGRANKEKYYDRFSGPKRTRNIKR